MSLPRIVVSENLAHGLRRMAASDQEPIRPRPHGRVLQRIMAEFATEREASDFGVAPALHDRRDRRLDDAIGDSATSQFVRDAQPTMTATEDELVRTPVRQRGIIEIAPLAEREHGRADRVGGEATARELRLDLDDRARCARKQTDGDVSSRGTGT
jgi:hypothetical protein